MKPSDINLITEQTNIATIETLLRDGTIDLSEHIQWHNISWSDIYASRLIESILLRIPLPPFYFDAAKKNWLVIDGLLRLRSLEKFMVNQTLILSNLPILTKLNGKIYSELSLRLRNQLAKYQVTCYLIKQGTSNQVRDEIFNRVKLFLN